VISASELLDDSVKPYEICKGEIAYVTPWAVGSLPNSARSFYVRKEYGKLRLGKNKFRVLECDEPCIPTERLISKADLSGCRVWVTHPNWRGTLYRVLCRVIWEMSPIVAPH
jgi:hypothetical protein